jgi:tRNA (guanosine-2'-O-)-methyltransferase
MAATVTKRTRRIKLVIQDIHNPHNISACLRTAEAFGIQDVDIVSHKEKYRPSGPAKGVGGWLTLRAVQGIAESVRLLRAEGFRIATAMPSPSGITLADLPVDKPIAIVFGNEHLGVDFSWQQHADYSFTVPMLGVVESLNISVAAGISLYTLRQKLDLTQPPEVVALPKEEQAYLLSQWICRQFRNWPEQLRRLKGGVNP